MLRNNTQHKNNQKLLYIFNNQKLLYIFVNILNLPCDHHMSYSLGFLMFFLFRIFYFEERNLIKMFKIYIDDKKINKKNIWKRREYIVTPRPLTPLMTTHRDSRLALQINTSLSSALWPHSCALGNTSQEITHPKIAPHQAHLTVEFLANGLPRKEDTFLLIWVVYQSFFKLNLGYYIYS